MSKIQRPNSLFNPGQVNLERRAMAGLAVDPNVSRSLIDNAINRCQPQAGSFTHLLGREIRPEDSGEGVLVQALASLSDC